MGTLQFRAIEFLPGSRWNLGKLYELQFSGDGNFVLSNNQTGKILWESATQGELLAMQADGNLVIYDSQGIPVWNSGTAGSTGAFLQARDDGTVEIASTEGSVLWRVPERSDAGPELPPPEETWGGEGTIAVRPSGASVKKGGSTVGSLGEPENMKPETDTLGVGIEFYGGAERS